MSSNGSMDMNSPSPGLGSSKYGTLVPNRIFVGGISSNTSEAELHALFSKYGNVKATKIIMDKAGISKGYGFVTFETEEEAQRIQKEVDSIVLKDRKLNIAPAIKKQPFARVLADPAQMISSNTILYQGAVPQTFNNAALLAGGDGLYLPQATYPVIYPHVVIPHQYHYQASAGSSYPQYLYTLQTPSDLYSYSGVPHTASHSSEYAESSASEASSEIFHGSPMHTILTVANTYVYPHHSNSDCTLLPQNEYQDPKFDISPENEVKTLHNLPLFFVTESSGCVNKITDKSCSVVSSNSICNSHYAVGLSSPQNSPRSHFILPELMNMKTSEEMALISYPNSMVTNIPGQFSAYQKAFMGFHDRRNSKRVALL